MNCKRALRNCTACSRFYTIKSTHQLVYPINRKNDAFIVEAFSEITTIYLLQVQIFLASVSTQCTKLQKYQDLQHHPIVIYSRCTTAWWVY